MGTSKLFAKYYLDKSDWIDGTTEYHNILRKYIDDSHKILELGSGPTNRTTQLLKNLGKTVYGLDIDKRVLANQHLDFKFVYEGKEFPPELKKVKFNVITCDYVMEHVEFPVIMLKEISDSLDEGGLFIFRTPNKYHYVSLISRFTPHGFHLLVANYVRRTPIDQVEPYPTFYRFNSEFTVKKVTYSFGLRLKQIAFVEKEPSYFRFNAFFFAIGILYERVVNSSKLFKHLRANIFVVVQK